MRSFVLQRAAILLVGGLGLGGTAALAADPDVQIQELRARAWRAPGGFTVSAHYDVNIDDPWRFPPLNITFFATDHGRPILDSSGQPVQVTVPLGAPVEYNGDIAHFAGDATVTLPGTYIGRPGALRLNASVVDPRNGMTLDENQTQLQLGRPVGHRRGFFRRWW